MECRCFFIGEIRYATPDWGGGTTVILKRWGNPGTREEDIIYANGECKTPRWSIGECCDHLL